MRTIAFIAFAIAMSTVGVFLRAGNSGPEVRRSASLHLLGAEEVDRSREGNAPFKVTQDAVGEEWAALPKLELRFLRQPAGDGPRRSLLIRSTGIRPVALADAPLTRERMAETPKPRFPFLELANGCSFTNNRDRQEGVSSICIGIVSRTYEGKARYVFVRGEAYRFFLDADPSQATFDVQIPETLLPGQLLTYEVLVTETPVVPKTKPAPPVDPRVVTITGKATIGRQTDAGSTQLVAYYELHNGSPETAPMSADGSFRLKVRQLGGSLLLISTDQMAPLFVVRKVERAEVELPPDADVSFPRGKDVEVVLILPEGVERLGQVLVARLLLAPEDSFAVGDPFLEFDVAKPATEEGRTIRFRHWPGRYFVKLTPLPGNGSEGTSVTAGPQELGWIDVTSKPEGNVFRLPAPKPMQEQSETGVPSR